MPRRSPASSSAANAFLFALAAWLPCSSSARAECGPIDDPFRVIDIDLTMDPLDWNFVRRDTTWELERPATFRACGEDPLPVKVRRKKGFLLGDDPAKPSLKIDFDDVVEGAEWHSHRKLSLENGIVGKGEFPPVLVREGLAWHILRQAGVITGGFSWVRLHVNGDLVGVYTRVEQIDKSFLRRRLGEDEGFLYKLASSGPDGIERLTRENEPDPFAPNLCFPPFGNACSVPADAVARVKQHLDVRQLLTIAAVNAAIGNSDALFSNTNNFFFYDSPRPRLYFPWDNDIVFLVAETFPPYSEGDPSSFGGFFLREPQFRAEYDAILRRILRDPLSPEAVGAFLDGLRAEVGPAMDADPNAGFEGGFAADSARLQSWVERRVAFLRTTIGPGPAPALVINEVLASNKTSGVDEAGNAADWVEIQNRGSEPIALGGLYLTDDPAEPLKWPFPAVDLPAGAFLVVWCDKDVDEGPLHAGFQLDAKGEAVGIYTVADGIVRALDFVAFGPQEPDISLGRAADGSPGFRLLPCPTPGAPNDGPCADGPRFLRGDADGDGRLSVTDAVKALGFLFRGQGIECEAAADVDGNGEVSLTDAVRALVYLFQGGPGPAAPFPDCGRGSSLPCAAHAACSG